MKGELLFSNALSNLRAIIEYNVVSSLRPRAPTLFLFPITNRCNSRCVMCNIWQEKEAKELNLNQIEEMLDDSIFKSIEHLTITGGEPTLRKDIDRIAKLLVEKCPRLKSIGMSTNGLVPKLVIKSCKAIAEACKESKVKNFFSVSLDGLGDVHDRVRRVPNAFERTFETIKALRELKCKMNFNFNVHCVVSNVNVYGLSDWKKWCEQKRIPFSFEAAHTWKRFLNENSDFHMTDEQINSFLKVLWTRIKEPAGSYYDWMTYRMLRLSRKRSLMCPFVVNAFSVHPDGNTYYCPGYEPIGNIFEDNLSNIYYDKQNLKYREWIRRNRCPSCTQSCFFSSALDRASLLYLQYRLIKRIMIKTG